MSIKEMWNYLIFQTKGYRQLGAWILIAPVNGVWSGLRRRYLLYQQHSLCEDH